MATFVTEIAKYGHHAWLSVTIAGLGPRTQSIYTTDPYRLASRQIDASRATTILPANVIPCLVELPGTISERIDLQAGTTELGALSFGIRVAAAPPTADGWTSLWDWFSTFQTGDTWILRSDATAADGHLDLVSNANLVIGQALYIGSETVVVDSIGGGGHDIGVTRGIYNSIAAEHLASPNGDGTLYDRPKFLRGRRVQLRLNLKDPCQDGFSVFSSTDERVIWSGLIDEWEMGDPHEMTISCRPVLGRLDRTIGRDQWSGTATGRLVGGRPNVCPFLIAVTTPDDAKSPLPSPWPVEDVDNVWHRRFYARLGDCLCECDCTTPTETSTVGTFNVVAIGMLGSPIAELFDANGEGFNLPICEVLLTNASPDLGNYIDGRTPLAPFTVIGDSTGSEHPIDLMLCLLTSTGTGANGGWDVLPATWGCGVPYAEIDVAAFMALSMATSGLRFPWLVIGYDSKPEALRDMLSREFLGPLGWFLHVDLDGLVSIGQLEDIYPDDATKAINKVIADSISLRGNLPDTISVQSWSYGWDWSKGQFSHVRRVTGVAAHDRLTEDDSEIAFEAKGLQPEETIGETTIGHRTAMISRWWTAPVPTLSLSVPLPQVIYLDVADLVELSGLDWPCPLTGGLDWDGVAAVITSRSIDLVGAKLDLELFPLPAGKRCLWAPSGTVKSVDGTLMEITLEHSHYTEDATGDAGKFDGGMYLGLYSSAGVPLCDAPDEVDHATGDVLYMADTFRIGGAPVAPVAGNIVTFVRYENGAAPEDYWAPGLMAEAAAQADGTATPPALPNADPPYEYGA